MITENTITYIPKEIVKQIKWYLRNYLDIDKFIKARKEYLTTDLTDYYHYTNSNYLKSIHSSGATLENTIIEVDEDFVIKKYKIMQKIINQYLKEKYYENDFITFWLLRYKFHYKRDSDFIKEKLNLNKQEYKKIMYKAFYDIYQRAIENGIYKEVA